MAWQQVEVVSVYQRFLESIPNDDFHVYTHVPQRAGMILLNTQSATQDYTKALHKICFLCFQKKSLATVQVSILAVVQGCRYVSHHYIVLCKTGKKLSLKV